MAISRRPPGKVTPALMIDQSAQSHTQQHSPAIIQHQDPQYQQMDLEVLHVSQLYESVAAVIVLILLIAEAVICHKQLWGHSFAIRFKQQQHESAWIKERFPDEDAAAGPDLEKSAIESLRREMTEYESKNSEKGKEETASQRKEEETKEANLQFLTELDASQKSTLLFYVQYNNFISEHFAIIFSLLVLGMLTYTTRIYSLASFFCYLFGSLLFDFLHLEERLKAQYKRGTTLRRVIKLICSLFVLGLFISYWSLREYGGA